MATFQKLTRKVGTGKDAKEQTYWKVGGVGSEVKEFTDPAEAIDYHSQCEAKEAESKANTLPIAFGVSKNGEFAIYAQDRSVSRFSLVSLYGEQLRMVLAHFAAVKAAAKEQIAAGKVIETWRKKDADGKAITPTPSTLQSFDGLLD